MCTDQSYLNLVNFLFDAGAKADTPTSILSWVCRYAPASDYAINFRKKAIPIEDRKFTNWKDYFAKRDKKLTCELKVLQLLVDHRAKINAKDKEGKTRLMNAYSSHPSILKFLTSHGAEVNLRDREGLTALGIARKNGQQDGIKFLLSVGAKE